MKIKNALISVFDKNGLDPLLNVLAKNGVKMYSTGGSYDYITAQGYPCEKIEDVTQFPEILGGRVKTLHPKVFGGILARRENEKDQQEVLEFQIPLFDLVIVDLYPFEETVKSSNSDSEIIEKIDIGGVSLIRAAAKNFQYTAVISRKSQYDQAVEVLSDAEVDESQRHHWATEAFGVCEDYDRAIHQWFMMKDSADKGEQTSTSLRYGENPHQQGTYHGKLDELWTQLNGKELSYNNLIDIDAAMDLMSDFPEKSTVAVLKHTNVCGMATRDATFFAWKEAHAGDPESAFGGIIISNDKIDRATAEDMNEIFFEVLLAPAFEEDALKILKSKKNRIILEYKKLAQKKVLQRTILNGHIEQDVDSGNTQTWDEVGARKSTAEEKTDLEYANKICKHLKSNAITLVRNKQLLGKGAGQTSRIDALRHAIAKANQFGLELKDAVMASDAFFPFDDCVRIAHAEGINAVIEPGGSIRDKDTISYCQENNMVLVMTGQRHFKH